MKKKHVVFMLIIVICALIALIGIRFFHFKGNDAVQFKKEYEKLNGQTSTSGQTYLSIEIAKNNKIVYATDEKIIDLLAHGTGVIYFGFPECPWCRNAVPVLLEAASGTGIEKIYYFNALSIRDVKKLDASGNVVTEKLGTDTYYQLVDAMSDVLGPYEGLNDDSILRLYFPTVVFVKDGVIIGSHEGTIDSQENPYVALTVEQKEELKRIYMNYIHEVLDDLCDTKC